MSQVLLNCCIETLLDVLALTRAISGVAIDAVDYKKFRAVSLRQSDSIPQRFLRLRGKVDRAQNAFEGYSFVGGHKSASAVKSLSAFVRVQRLCREKEGISRLRSGVRGKNSRLKRRIPQVCLDM